MPRAAVIVVLCLVATAFATAAEPPTTESQIDELFAKWDRTDSPGCAVGVFRDGEIVYARGYGMANLEYGVALTPRSVFRIASMSKQFTATAVAILVEKRTISFYDEIHRFFPELQAYEVPVVVNHLIHHTSGLRDYLELADLAGLGDVYSVDEAFELVAHQKALNYEAGDHFLYSNTNYFLLALLVERVTGQSLKQLAQEMIFGPLGMKDTHFHDDHTHLVRNRADGYARRNGAFHLSMTELDMVGDGGVYTTIEDLLLWDRNFYDNRLGRSRPELIELLLSQGQLSSGIKLCYAFGLDVCHHRGLQVVSHSGAFVGFRTEMVRLPEQKLSVAVLCNLSEVNPVPLARQVAALYLGDLMEPEEETGGGTEEVEVAPESLARLVGHYWNVAEAEARRVYVDQGKLLWDRGSSTSELLPLGDDRFKIAGLSLHVEVSFEPPGALRPERVVTTLNGGRWGVYEPFVKLTPAPEDLAGYVGTYRSVELERSYAVQLRDGALTLGIPRVEEPPRMEPQRYDVFTVPGIGAVAFTRGAGASVDGFVLDGDRVRKLKFVRE